MVTRAALPPTVPPLPDGAYPEWDLGKAWHQESGLRSKICLNGLWRFRSEPRLEVMEEVETYFEDAIEEETIEDWSVGEIPGAMLDVGLDPTQKTRGNASMRVDLEIPANTNFYHLTRLATVPSGVKLTLRVDIRAEMERGDLHIEVQDARDYKIYTVMGETFGSLPEWKTIECGFVAPPGTSAVKILILRNHGANSGCKGTVWLDNLRIAKIDRPAAPGITPPTDDQWGFLKVPGSWNSRHWSWRGKVYWHTDDLARTRSHTLRFGWFERELTVPEAWDGRRILVQLDRVSTDARVYCDGVEAGSTGYMGGTVEVTRFARPGQPLKLAILVQARDSWDILPGLLTKPSKSWQAMLPVMGIAGDVFLVSEPREGSARLGRCRIVTTAAEKTIWVASELLSPADGAMPAGLSIRCEVRDGEAVVKRFEARVAAGAAIAECATDWPEATFWEIGNSKLYTLHVALIQSGRVIDEVLPERFGFREFEIRGKFFYLNGIKLNLVPSSYCGFKLGWATKDAMRHWVTGALEAGYNFVYLGETDRPGKPEVASHLLEVCDELGMLCAVSPLGIGHSVYRRMDKPETWDRWTPVVRERVRKDWNHPSLVLWRMNMNLNCYRQDQNPLVLDGEMTFEPESSSAIKEAAMLKSNAYVRGLDPTRPTYNHACGKTGDIYNLNNYLGWPELQDLREWLRVWAEEGEKPMYMAEQATPYPGDFQMRDPTNWWTNEPVMTEYGAILLGEEAYKLEEHDYVGYYDIAWDAKGKSWRSSYGYFCHAYPPTLDVCSSRYYEAMLPAWRTWGISGGVNAWENTWRRLIKRTEGGVLRQTVPDLPIETDWENLQRPGFSADVWQYAHGGGGEIRCLFDLGRPEEKEYVEPTMRGRVMPELIAPLYAYIGGPEEHWFAQDHAFRSGETVAKSIVLLNDRRRSTTFSVSWQVTGDGQVIAGGTGASTVAPAESARLQFRFDAPSVEDRTDLRVTASVSTNGTTVPVRPFGLQVYPVPRQQERLLSGWVLCDPGGKTLAALREVGLTIPIISPAAQLPADARVLAIGCNALGQVAGSQLVSDLSQRVAAGLQVLVFEQTAEALRRTFSLRCFTPGARRVWIRDAGHSILRGMRNDELTNWRGGTTLAPLDGPPESLDTVQRWDRVWRCSQLGVVASIVVEKPHIGPFRSLVDTGFDLRYTPLWEVTEGAGRMVFCQLDVSGRVGRGPVADRLLGNVVADIETWRPRPTGIAMLVATSASAPLSALRAAAADCPVQGAGHVLIVPRGGEAWLNRNASAIKPFLNSGGTLLAAGLSEAETQMLIEAVGGVFGARANELWLNPLSGELPSAFRGVSPAAIHWRKKLTVPVVATLPDAGWRCETGVLASIPVGKGEIVWVSALPEDFDPEQRPDLVFSRVNTERLYSIVLGNLGVQGGAVWSSCLSGGGTEAKEERFYTDQRAPRDDPYADMRW